MLFKQKMNRFLSLVALGVLGVFPVSGCSSSAETATVGGAIPSPVISSPPVEQATASTDMLSFEAWREGLRREALQRGISAQTLNKVMPTLQYLPRVVELDRKQPEFSQTFAGYFSRAVSERRISDGKAMLAKHRQTLERVVQQYGVQPRFLVAFWGMETSYGANFGGFSVLSALATLAYDQRRPEFFRKELFAALAILEAGDISPSQMVGSWAGAMGNLQFMPSTFRAHAVDQDGDGKRDIWGSLPDTFASAAKYLSDEGWNASQGWGQEVRLPSGFDYSLADLSIQKPVAEWKRLGVLPAAGGALSISDQTLASVIVPAGAQGPAFLVLKNFRVIMIWNRSILYALAVSYLADQFIDGPRLVVSPPANEMPLRRADVEEMQTLLQQLGFDPGTIDGMAGSKTRNAIKAFQQRAGLIADAYPSLSVLKSLRKAARKG